MVGLFIALGIAILTLIAILLWFVPHLLQQHTMQVAQESARLRELIGEMVREHESVAMRQAQLGTSIAYLQDQLEQVVTLNLGDDGVRERLVLAQPETESLQRLESRLAHLQHEIDRYIETTHQRNSRENESWVHLLHLLHSMQDRLQAIPLENGRYSSKARRPSGGYMPTEYTGDWRPPRYIQ